MSEPYFYEFLWRDRDPEDDTPPAFHIGLCARTPDPFGGPPQYHTRILNMRQADEAGWPLPKALEAVNTAALRELEAQVERNETLAGELAKATAQADGRLEQLNAALVRVTALEQALAAAQAEAQKAAALAAGLQAQIDGQAEPVADTTGILG